MTLEEFLSECNNGSDRVLVHTSGSTGQAQADVGREEANAQLGPHHL